jgi:hypothetical protein
MPTTSLFEPDDPNELLRGWLLHAHKGRDRHDLAARRCDQRRYLIGVPATIVLAIVAAILTSLQTFLDLGARAERHRLAGVRYKAVIRHLEQLGIGTIKAGLDAPVVTELRQRLDALEEEMPVVSPAIYDQVEAKYRDPAFIDAVVQRPAGLGRPG